MSGRHAVAHDPRPNVLLLVTDDQTLHDLAVMPNVQGMIGGQGATFANSFANNPLCCPARASVLTGQYSHNHGVLTNATAAGGGFPAFDDSSTL
ncbi:MAG: sulfatase-like hydrolase/transferase, partial [Nocardioidaceae bacterium]|nr:sulfatase-like hydrolase/transferase [Nocardioidaceae bacterium]